MQKSPVSLADPARQRKRDPGDEAAHRALRALRPSMAVPRDEERPVTPEK